MIVNVRPVAYLASFVTLYPIEHLHCEIFVEQDMQLERVPRQHPLGFLLLDLHPEQVKKRHKVLKHISRDKTALSDVNCAKNDLIHLLVWQLMCADGFRREKVRLDGLVGDIEGPVPGDVTLQTYT